MNFLKLFKLFEFYCLVACGEHRRAQESTGEHRREQERTREHRSAQESTGEHWRAQERTGVHRRAQESTGENRRVQESTGEHRSPTSTEISIGYPMDVRADPVGCPSWTSYGCLKDILMSSPVDVQLGISMDVQKTDVFGIS